MTTCAVRWQQWRERQHASDDQEQQSQARLLGAILLAIIPLVILWPLGTTLIHRDPACAYLPDLWLCVAVASVLVVAFVANRVGRYYLGAALTILAVDGGTLVATILTLLGRSCAYASNDVGLLVYLVFSLLLCSILFSLRVVGVLALTNGVAMLLLALLFPQVGMVDIVAGPLVYLVLFTPTLVVVMRQRERLERMHQAELAEKEARYCALLETTFDAVLVHENGRLIEVNSGFLRLFGITRERAMGMAFMDLIADSSREAVARYMRAGDEYPYQILAYRSDGSPLHLEAVARSQSYHGRPARVVALRDIGERMAADAEREALLVRIRLQADRMQQILDTVSEGVLLLDANCRIVLSNPAGKRMCELMGAIQADDRLAGFGDRPLSQLLSPAPTGTPREIGVGERVFQLSTQPVESGATRGGWVLVIRDITRAREIEQRAREQERLASLGQLAAGIAHDFNNLMAVIVLLSQLELQQPDLPQRSEERLQVIAEQGKLAAGLTQQILDFSRSAVLDRQPLSVTPFLIEMVSLLERTMPKNVRVSLTYDVGEYMVRADRTRLQQALMNLALNARDAVSEREHGELTIALKRVCVRPVDPLPDGDLEPGEWVRLRVADNGEGIPAEVKARIFEPFFTTKGVGKGTGLGLAQVYGIVKQHEGHVKVTSEPGAGAVFDIFLPALPVIDPVTVVNELADLPTGQGELVLLVEENDVTRQALSDGLQALNYRVLPAGNERQARGLLVDRAGELALVVSSLLMPEMGDTLSTGRTGAPGSDLPLIMLSGNHPGHNVGASDLPDVTCWLQKPVALDTLAEKVALALRSPV